MIWKMEWGKEVVFGYEFDAILAEAFENWLDRWSITDEGIEVPR